MIDIPAIEIIGLIAGAFKAATALPQAYKIFKTKKAKAVSLTAYIMFHLSCILWLIYGVIVSSFSVIFWNAISYLITGAVIILKIMDMRKNKEEGAR